MERFHVNSTKPLLDGLGYELGAVVRAYVGRWSACDNSSASAANTSSLLSLRPTGKARHSRFHTTADLPAFNEAIARALPLVAQGWPVTFSITPDARKPVMATPRWAIPAPRASTRLPASWKSPMPMAPRRYWRRATMRERGHLRVPGRRLLGRARRTPARDAGRRHRFPGGATRKAPDPQAFAPAFRNRWTMLSWNIKPVSSACLRTWADRMSSAGILCMRSTPRAQTAMPRAEKPCR